MAWPAPNNSKTRVRRAGEAAAKAYRIHGITPRPGQHISLDDYTVIQNWRRSHGAVLNNARGWLNRFSRNQSPILGQRLKRFDTMIEKLANGRMSDLSRMNDIAGIRLLFLDEMELQEFRERLEGTRAAHKRIYQKDQYDYIEKPKETGYRGIHDVFERQVNSEKSSDWNGLRFEVQMRTAVQHAWATAVETYDNIKRVRYKFEPSDDPAYEQFRLISELLARVHEGRYSCFPDLDERYLVDRITEIEQTTHLISILQNLRIAIEAEVLRDYSILAKTSSGELTVVSFTRAARALDALDTIEKLGKYTDVVLVRANTPGDILNTHRNYFGDTSDFIALLIEAREVILLDDYVSS